MKKAIIFVHGLGGSAKDSWGKFPELIEGDSTLNFEYGFFEYPTQIIRIPVLQKKYASIQDLAKALKTFITYKYDMFDELILVGHSLGGLVIRQYLLDEHISGHKTKVSKVLFYAVPQLGAILANIGNLVSWKHRQLKQLCIESDFLDVLNDNWVNSKVDDKLDIQCVIGLADKIVSSESSKSICRQHTIDMLPDKGHKDIIKPNNSEDLNFIIFKNFVHKELLIKYTELDGALTYDQWAGYDESQSYPFIPDEMRLKAIEDIRSLLIEPKKSARIIGLSGLGKTRLALEVFRYEIESTEIQEKVLYIDIANGFPSLSSIVSSWAIAGYRGILVVDNCDHSMHMQLKHQVEHLESNLSLLTLDYNLEKDEDTRTIKLERLSDDHIKQMLEAEYGDLISDLGRIISMAQGFPQIAVLLIQARLSQSNEMGSLTDDYLLRKMLWKSDEQNDTHQKILRACALFDKLGMKDGVTEEYHYIADNICDESRDMFYECIQNFKERGLIDERGRYIQLVPKPLAVRLAVDWWKNTRPEKRVELITQEMPGQLNTAFCDQMIYLDFVPEAVELVENICEEGVGPFGQAEVILSNQGSRLFRSLVEVNPEATLNALYRVISPMTEEQVLSISRDVRRNIVWSLEKLSFRKSEFQNAARLLLKLAVSENESWSNNATGQFIQLFQTYLSGTEAPPELRLVIIDEAIASENNKQIEIAIKALEAAISIGHNMRSGGAENQGSGKPLKDWEPKIWQEVFDYWDGAIQRLTDIIISNELLKDNGKQVLAHNIRELFVQGRIESMDSALKTIVEHDGKFWPDAIESIKDAIKYDSDNFPDEGIEKLKEWLELLNPEDIVERLKLIISVPPYTYEEDGEGNYIDQAHIDAESLSKEIIENPSDLMNNLPILLTGEQRQARTLGRIFAEETEDILDFIEQGLTILKTIEFPNPELIIAMMNVQKNKEKSIWDTFIGRVIKDDDLVKFLPRFLQSSKPSVVELQSIIDQIKEHRLEINALRHFGSGRSLDHLSSEDIKELLYELLSLQEEGAWIALDILSMYTHGSIETFVALVEIIKRVILQIEYETTNNEVMDFYYLEQAIKKINNLAIDEEFIIAISENIFKQAFSKDIKARGSLKKIVHYLIKEHGNIVWPILFKHIEELTPMQEFRMQQMIGHRSNTDSDFALVNDIPDEKIIELCKQSEKSASALAKSIKVVTEVDGEWKFTPVAMKMIDEFGDQAGVLLDISSNMHSFSWVGSSAPYYKRQEKAFEDLLAHQNKNVREWAKNEITYLERCIKDEEQRKDERDFGIY